MSSDNQTPEKPYKSPYEKAGILSKIHFSWALPFVRKINKLGAKKIKVDDIPNLGQSESTQRFAEKFQKNYDAYIEYEKKTGKKVSNALYKAVFKGVGLTLLLAFCCEMIFVGIRLFFGYILNRLFTIVKDEDKDSDDAVPWAIALFACVFASFYIHAQIFYLTTRTNVAIKLGVISMIYKKVSKVSLFSIQKLKLGKIINLIANDVNIFDFPSIFLIIVCLAPFIYIGGAVLLWTFFGPVCLAGIGYMAITLPFQNLVIGFSKNARDQKHLVTDERIKMTNEAIDSIRLLKMYAWEINFRDIIKKLRQREDGYLRTILSLEFFNKAMAFSSPAIASFLIFAAYVKTGEELSVDLVFPCFYVMVFLRMYANLFFNVGLIIIMETRLFFNRVTQILETPEINMSNVKETPKDPHNMIEYENYNGFWMEAGDQKTGTLEAQDELDKKKAKNPSEKYEEKPTPNGNDSNTPNLKSPISPNKEQKPVLNNLNFTIPKGSLTAVVGSIGAGKTSLLLSLTGEIPHHTGSMRFNGTTAYVEQEPIIFSGTVREIICFGKEYKEIKYQRAIEAACLPDDFKLFPNGDLTEIGEKGINLSGGQKARISLARAIYSDSDIYLLDDPLSAVDTKVAKKLYEEGIKNALAGKTVLLVTHQVHFVKECENIIVMEEGRVTGFGSFNELKEQGVDLEKIFADNQKKLKKDSMNETQNATELSLIETLKAETEKIKTEKQEFDADKGKLFKDEDLHEGAVTFKTYVNYLKSSFGLFSFLVFLFFLIGNEVANVAYGRMIALWADSTLSEEDALLACGCLMGAVIFFYVCKNIIWVQFAVRGTTKTHNKMIDKIVRSPTTFFDTNPIGRILNRFSNDTGILDRLLLFSFFDIIEGLAFFLGIFLTVFVINPIVLIPVFIAVIGYIIAIKVFGKPFKISKGLELTTRSPVYSQFSSTLPGLVVIRAFQQEKNLQDKFDGLINNHGKAAYYFWTAQRILGFTIDYISTLCVIASILILILTKDDDSDVGLIALGISFMLNLTEYMQWLLRQAVTTDMLMASSARMENYTKLQTEADLVKDDDRALVQKKWPIQGTVDFNSVYMKYREDMDHVIKGLSVSINAKEKIGCIGRTGAGKSSIIQILFRMVEIDRNVANGKKCSVEIDDQDTLNVGLHLLRNSISIIPQTPVVFSGTIRRNLDPMGEHSDAELKEVLADVQLKEYVDNLEKGLDTDMSNATSIFSVGQKQLICLARAILKKTRIIVLDEATANVDFSTDLFIQKKIMEKFSDCTVFTIAHRLSTIANYDKVLVLDKGQKAEFDAPYKLLVERIGDQEITNKSGLFAAMVEHTGKKSAKAIFDMAKQHYYQ